MPGVSVVLLLRAKPHELFVRGMGEEIVPDVAGMVLVGVVVFVRALEVVLSVDRYSLQLDAVEDGAVMVVVNVSCPALMTLVSGTVSSFSLMGDILPVEAMDTEYLDGSMVPRFSSALAEGITELASTPPPQSTKKQGEILREV